MRNRLAFALCAVLALAPIAAPAQITRTNRVADASGGVTTGGTSQTAIAANSDRAGLLCQNPITGTEAIYLDFGRPASTSASGGSIQLAPGGSFVAMGNAVPTTAVNVTSVTTGSRFICKEFLNQ